MGTAEDVADRETLLLRGSLDMCVLAILDREPLHTYAVVERLTELGFATGYGTVYPLTSRLRRSGLLDQRPEPGHGGPARQVLTLTPAGSRALGEWTAQWRTAVDRVGRLLDPAGGELRVG